MNRKLVSICVALGLGFSQSVVVAQVCIDGICLLDRGQQTGEIVLGYPRGGLAVIDYDNDGWQDLVIADLPPSTTHLWHNVPDPVNPTRRTFQNVTTGSGLDDADNSGGLSFAVVAADYDNDGFTDVYLSGQAAGGSSYGRLYRNNGNGTFTNTSISSGVRALAIQTLTASWNDYDLDGFMDLLLVASGAPPATLRLMHNNGDGTFSDAGSLLPPLSYLGTVYAQGWGDYDGDGYADCFIPGTSNPVILKNVDDGLGDRKFVNSASTAGFTSLGPAPMGVAFGDHDNDGDFDLCFTDAVGGTYYNNLGGGNLVRVYPFTTIFGWGTTWLDVDNDGDVDNYQCGSYGSSNYDRLHRNLGAGQWQDISPALNGPFAASEHSVQVDFNNDGRQDLITINPGSAHVVSVYENMSTTGNHWISIKLRGDGMTVNRNAIGAVVRVTAGGTTRIRQVASGTSTDSTEDLRAHFGLGTATTVDQIEVIWPMAGTLVERTDVYAGPFAADQFMTLMQTNEPCPAVFGDVFPIGPPAGDCVVTLDDILCVLTGFGNVNQCPSADLLPCGGNGIINLDDILGELAAFGGADLCP